MSADPNTTFTHHQATFVHQVIDDVAEQLGERIPSSAFVWDTTQTLDREQSDGIDADVRLTILGEVETLLRRAHFKTETSAREAAANVVHSNLFDIEVALINQALQAR